VSVTSDYVGSVRPWARTVTLTAAATTLTVDGIPAIPGASLLITVTARSDREAQASDLLRVQFGTAGVVDTGASYLYIAREITDTTAVTVDTAATEDTSMRFGRTSIPGASAAASIPGGGAGWVPAYANTTFFKLFQVAAGHVDDSVSNDVYRTAISSAVWKNTAAVDTVLIFPELGTNLTAGSSMRVVVL